MYTNDSCFQFPTRLPAEGSDILYCPKQRRVEGVLLELVDSLSSVSDPAKVK